MVSREEQEAKELAALKQHMFKGMNGGGGATNASVGQCLHGKRFSGIALE